MVLVHLELIINSSTCRFSVWRPLCARLHAEMKVVERRRRVRALHQRRKKDKKVRLRLLETSDEIQTLVNQVLVHQDQHQRKIYSEDPILVKQIVSGCPGHKSEMKSQVQPCMKCEVVKLKHV